MDSKMLVVIYWTEWRLLKTEVGGVLFSATSWDANNQIYPIAIDVVIKKN